jgi:NlpC/P60 family putative phage cell wall peptidase
MTIKLTHNVQKSLLRELTKSIRTIFFTPSHFLGLSFMTRFITPQQRMHIYNTALTWLNTPYIHQARTKHIGTDCLGLILGIWQEIYGNLPQQPPAYTRSWRQLDTTEPLLTAAFQHLQPVSLSSIDISDLLFFRMHAAAPVKHIGLYMGKNKFLHAYEKRGTILEPLVDYWKKHLQYAFLFLPE